MTRHTLLSEYLVISRGQWDKDKSPEEIQQAIDSFYAWHDRLVSEGTMKGGQRLAREAKMARNKASLTGPLQKPRKSLAVTGSSWPTALQKLQHWPHKTRAWLVA